MLGAFPDHRWTSLQLLLEGEWLAVHLEDLGTQGGSFLGLAATGKVITIPEFAFYRWSGGKMVEVWVTADNAVLLSQRGALQT